MKGLSADETRLMRNEIFARHGKIFKSEDLKNYFGQQSWYKPTAEEVEISDLEKKNVDFLKAYKLRLTIVSSICRYVSTTEKQPFTSLGFNHLKKVGDGYGCYTADFYGTKGVGNKRNTIIGDDGRTGTIQDDGFTGIIGEALAINDLHCDDFSPTMVLYADKSMKADFEQQLKGFGFRFTTAPNPDDG